MYGFYAQGATWPFARDLSQSPIGLHPNRAGLGYYEPGVHWPFARNLSKAPGLGYYGTRFHHLGQTQIFGVDVNGPLLLGGVAALAGAIYLLGGKRRKRRRIGRRLQSYL